MVKIEKVDPRETAVDITSYANKQFGISIGIHTARNRLREANLLARKPSQEAIYK